MQIWDKLIWGAGAIVSIGFIGGGAYTCIVSHSPAVAIPMLMAGGGFLALNCAKLLDKKEAYFDCSYREEESIGQVAKQLAAYQEKEIRQMKEEKKQPKSPVLEKAPIAFPENIQLQEIKIDNKEQDGPNNDVLNPFATNFAQQFEEKNLDNLQK